MSQPSTTAPRADRSQGRNLALLALWLGCLGGCAPRVAVPLMQAAAQPGLARDPQLRVTCRALPEPVPLRGEAVAYTHLDRVLTAAVDRAAQPFVERHRARRPAGWDLLLEISQAEARRRHGQVSVLLTVGASLRARDGQIHLGQTQAYCRESAAAGPRDAAPVFQGCIESIGRDVAAWLGGVEP